MSEQSRRASSVSVAPFDSQKKAGAFFAEKPWDEGPPAFDPRQWSASRFFDLFRDDEPLIEVESPVSGVSSEQRGLDDV